MYSGHDLSRAFSPLSSHSTQGLAALLSLTIAWVAPPSIASALMALLTAALLAARALRYVITRHMSATNAAAATAHVHANAQSL